MDLGETIGYQTKSAEGEFAKNSQAEGPNPDETLESKYAPTK